MHRAARTRYSGRTLDPRREPLFEVKILYREPLHELWSESTSRPPFVARYGRIEANSHREAVRIAEMRFESTARESQVRWHRQVVEVRVRPQG
jgi:hypothetical protein